jgi:uncharacterized membrane protein
MNFAVLAAAPLAVQVHLATVLPAFLIGGWSLSISRPGSVAHRAAGRVFAALMAITAATTVFIPSHFGVALTAGPLRMSPIRLFFGSIVIAGLFTLLPGRRLHHFLFL